MKIWRCSLVCVFVGLLLLSCAGAPQATVETPASACQGVGVEDVYLSAQVDYEAARVTATEVVTFFNDGESDIPSVVLHLPPAKYGFSLDRVSIDPKGKPANYQVNGIVLEIFEPVPAGGYTFIDLKFTLDVPAYSKGLPRTSVISDAIILGNWFPTPAVCEGGDWDRHQWTDIGDPFYTECTDFTVLVTLKPSITLAEDVKEPLMIAATGELVWYRTRQWKFEADNARDFAMAIGPFQTRTSHVGGTGLTVYTLDGHLADFVLDAVAEEIGEMNAQVGPYAYKSLDVVIVPTPGDSDAWGMEYPSIIMFYGFEDLERLHAENWAEMIARHETVHEWFYAAVGNDQVDEPWLDEAFAVYFSEPVAEPVHRGIDRSVTDFTDWKEYSAVVYRGAAAFLVELRDYMGKDAFYAGIKEYYAAYRFGIATTEDFFGVMQRYSSRDLKPLIKKYFNKAYL